VSLLSFVNWNIRIGAEKVVVDQCVSRLTTRGWVGSHAQDEAVYVRGVADRPWEPALFALAGLLGTATGGRARVVLSNSLVHYAVLPWNRALAGEREERIFLEQRFRQLYGEARTGWQIRCERAPAGRTRLASAIDTGLVTGLSTLLGSCGITHYSAVPALADTLNRYRGHLDQPSAWLVSHDDDSLCLARWHDWKWMAARSLRADGDWRHRLAAVLAREECLHDAPDATDTVFLDAAGDDLPSLAGWNVRPLRSGVEVP